VTFFGESSDTDDLSVEPAALERSVTVVVAVDLGIKYLVLSGLDSDYK
jgi:hypothetical protein